MGSACTKSDTDEGIIYEEHQTVSPKEEIQEDGKYRSVDMVDAKKKEKGYFIPDLL